MGAAVRTPTQQFWALHYKARSEPGQPLKPAAEETINGQVVRAECRTVNRKCWDALPTPTVSYTLNGKRASRDAVLKAINKVTT